MLFVRPDHARTRPQVHTRRNHDTYDGTHHLPLAVHVCPRPDGRERCFSITLFYAHNRACEIYRSPDDFLALHRALKVTLSPGKPEPPCSPSTEKPLLLPRPAGDRQCLPNSSSSSGNGSPINAATSHHHLVPLLDHFHPSSAPLHDRCLECGAGPTAEERRLCAGLSRFLEWALGQVRPGEPGRGGEEEEEKLCAPSPSGPAAMVAVEWFLRRRAGDCGGR